MLADCAGKRTGLQAQGGANTGSRCLCTEAADALEPLGNQGAAVGFGIRDEGCWLAKRHRNSRLGTLRLGTRRFGDGTQCRDQPSTPPEAELGREGEVDKPGDRL